MFDCSYDAQVWIRHALKCLPEDILDTYFDRLAFVCMDTSDARRLTSSFCEGRDIIVLSERIIPRGPLCEDNPRVRSFWFAVLHEIAHAVSRHLAPSQIAETQNQAQEIEADQLAFEWFNHYLVKKDLPKFSVEELAQAKIANQEASQIR
jgi:hypothetical protein